MGTPEDKEAAAEIGPNDPQSQGQTGHLDQRNCWSIRVSYLSNCHCSYLDPVLALLLDYLFQ